MIYKIFDEIKKEARNSEIVLVEDSFDRLIRIGFNVVDDNISNSLPNFYIKNQVSFYKILYEYVYLALDYYGLDNNYYNIKKVLTFVWSNITLDEMKDLEQFLNRYINYLNDTMLVDKKGLKYTSIGNLNYEVSKQSIQQETPYCFKSYFEKEINGELAKYSLPRVSFGISNGVCYIYAIQNKDTKINTNSIYNLEVRNKFRTINSGIKKYRNVTPSFVVALSLFISFLKENNISKVSVVTPLPLRQMNRELVANYRIQFETKRAILTSDNLENFKKEIINKKLENDYNATVKFVNCFNRLKTHFDSIYLSNKELSNDMIIDIINLETESDFLQEIVRSQNIFDKERKR